MKLVNSLHLTRHTLTMDSRDFWIYFQSFFLGATTFLIFYAAQNRVDTGSAGLYFFGIYFPLLAIAGTIGAINIFSGAVSQEKENGIIDLLVLSGLRPLNFLTGRFFGKYFQMLKLLVMQIPFCLFGITLGGVTNVQLASSFFIIAVWFLFCGLVCFFISILYSTRKESLMVSYIIGSILFFVFMPFASVMDVLDMTTPEFRLFPGTVFSLLLAPFLFGWCCSRFDKNSIAPIKFLRKKEEKDRNVKLTMELTEKERSEMKERVTIRFLPFNTLRQKDEFIHPPAPIIPFVVLFVKKCRLRRSYDLGDLAVFCDYSYVQPNSICCYCNSLPCFQVMAPPRSDFELGA